MAVPATRYAKSGDVHIAYQVFGSGAIDLVFVPGYISHLENYWDHPDTARWLLRLGSFARHHVRQALCSKLPVMASPFRPSETVQRGPHLIDAFR